MKTFFTYFYLLLWAVSAMTFAELPQNPIYLWSEKPVVTPDREEFKDQRVYSVDNPSMIPYWPSPEKANGTAVVIFPGGGYVRLAIQHEGHDIARWFAERGVAAFVVKYRMKEYGAPAPLLDGLRAVRTVRQFAKEWSIDPGKIGVIGFSAGGHLAASVALKSDFPLEGDPLVAISGRPDFAILGYPVISMTGEETHAGSRKSLMGENPEAAKLLEFSLEKQVKTNAPPMFIFHSVGDPAVPVANSLNLFIALQKVNKQSELHIYHNGDHGVGMVPNKGPISYWPDALEHWLKHNHWLP